MIAKVCSLAFVLSLSSTAQMPLAITSVTNGADFRPGFSQRGSLTSVFLTGLDGVEGTVVDNQNPLTTDLLGIEVWVNFAPAPILSVSSHNNIQQIDIQIPWEGGRDPLYLEVFQGDRRASFEGPYTNLGFAAKDNFSVWFVDATGRALVQHADHSDVTPLNPARPGEYLVAFGINLGPVTNVPATGYPAPANPQSILDPAAINGGICTAYDAVLVGSSMVSPTYDGLAPGLVGVYQVNFQVPASSSGGVGPADVPLAIQRTTVVFPFGVCHPGAVQTITTTVTSARATLAVAP
jgi:uncharacterized protein (TIGR03437 family)